MAGRRSRGTAMTSTLYADDLAALVKDLGITDAIHVGHTTGGGEVARYIARHGTKRVAKATECRLRVHQSLLRN